MFKGYTELELTLHMGHPSGPSEPSRKSPGLGGIPRYGKTSPQATWALAFLWSHNNDPAAGSPTTTLLRLLLPLTAGHCPILAEA